MITDNLRTMLNAIMDLPEDRTRWLVAADAAQEASEPECEWFLRHDWPDGTAFLPTGSRVYGTPKGE